MELELLDKSAYDDEEGRATLNVMKPYSGPDRRVENRRSAHDRRSMVRFELGKEDRRSLDDRRTTTNIWDKGHTLF
ncbi:MAG TPA: hypothetical protein ENI65_03380 [Gammaproteobacteria bacterium]|nr:hypothetical protein [Gammaproteobacteria bacterium]